jgi:hypothetical protein
VNSFGRNSHYAKNVCKAVWVAGSAGADKSRAWRTPSKLQGAGMDAARRRRRKIYVRYGVNVGKDSSAEL